MMQRPDAERVDTSEENNVDPALYFSSSYEEAREKFLKVARDKTELITSFEHELKGAQGEDLAIDTAWLGPKDASRVFVISSGTHGVEGFMGSAAQVGALSLGHYDSLPDATAVLFIHAINPWGFSWLRRVNEDGLDLNRNFIDFTLPTPRRELFDELVDGTLLPKSLGFFGTLQADLSLLRAKLKYGEEKLKLAIAGGQYDHPLAPMYGGAKPSWSNQTLRGIVRENLTRAATVVVIDYHTGIGDYATGEIIGMGRPGSAVHTQEKNCFGDRYLSLFDEDTVAYDATGVIPGAYFEELPDTNVLWGFHEFGTLSKIAVFKALRADHWLHAYGDPHSKRGVAISRKLRDAFYCDNDHWRAEVLRLSFETERSVMRFLAKS
ncbi:MAG: M14 family metallopeptidase [Pseudomonadota bacterium]